MKTAIILFGNLRTFLMPTRENHNLRLCDMFMRHIILSNNNIDIFAFTDTNDFYYNGTQYYATDRKIEVLNNDSFRIYDKVDFIDNNSARNIISEQFKIMGNNLKSFHIEDPFNAATDPKFNLLHDANVIGSSPTLLIHQFRKLKLAHELIKQYEKENNISYDIIVKWRFDISVHGDINFSKYDYINQDVYVAGVHGPIIYDWHAFGTRHGMDLCLSLYDFLGSFLNEGKAHLKDNTEITLSPEYHLYRVFEMNKIKYCNSGYPACPYRYKDISIRTPINDVMKKLNIDATLITYTASNAIGEQQYKK